MPVRLKMFKAERGMNCKLYVVKDTSQNASNPVYLVCREDRVGEPVEVMHTTNKFREIIEHAKFIDFDGVLMCKVHIEVPDIEDRAERNRNTVLAPIANFRESDKADMEVIRAEVIKLMIQLDEDVFDVIKHIRKTLELCGSTEGESLACSLYSVDRNLSKLFEIINVRNNSNTPHVVLLISIVNQYGADGTLLKSYRLLQKLLDSQALGEVDRAIALLKEFKESGIANIGQLMNILEAEFNANRRIKKSNSF